MVDIKKFVNMDLYGLLEININAEEQEIRKAYRRKALQYHPDKNPDNPKAAELFQTLSKTLEILLDSNARAAYDRVIKSKKAAELRHQQLDSKRQKFKSDLEERERAANKPSGAYFRETKTAEELLQDEIERLRKEGSRLVEEEQLLMQKHLAEERQKLRNHWDSSQHRIKIKWQSTKTDVTNGGYNEEILRKFLQKYGDIVVLVMSPKKCGSALIEFQTQEAAEMAVAYEKGIMSNPLTLNWINGAPKMRQNSDVPSTITDNDYETLVLRQMRQAEERKRLIEQMMKDDQDGNR